MNVVFEDLKNQRNLVKPNEVTDSGISRTNVSPYFNRLHLSKSYSKLINPLDVDPNPDPLGKPKTDGRNFIEYENVKFPYSEYKNPNEFKGKYIIPVGVNEDPLFWTGKMNNWPHLFELLNDQYLKDLQSKRAFLAIDTSLEGYHTEWLWDWFRKSSSDYKIPISQIIYITGNSIVEDSLDNWKLNNNNKKNVTAIGYPHFEFEANFNKDILYQEGKTLPTWHDHYNFKKKNQSKIKLYNFLNRKPRSHRMFFYSLLYHNKNLLDKGIISINKSWGDVIKVGNHILDPEIVNSLNEDLPIRAFGEDNTGNPGYFISRFHTKAYLHSYISLISEAQFDDEQNTIFLSEKIFKVIACQQPFIVLGNKHSLRELRKMGYKTFSNAWHEGYDICDNINRMKAIIDVLENIKGLPKMDLLHWTQHNVERNFDILKFNSLFKPPVGFHNIRELLEEDLCTTSLDKIII